MKKGILISIIIILIVVFLVYFSPILKGIYISGIFSCSVDESRIENEFGKYEVLFSTVNEYLIASNKETIYIPEENNNITEKDVLKAIKSLKRIGYYSIIKDNDAISYLRWAKLDEGRGLVYSINGNEPILQFSTKIEPLPEKNWYYYEEDFNEWRKTH